MIPGLSTAKLIGFAIGAAAILSFVILSLHWKHTMTERGDQLAAICHETRVASGVPKLNCAEVVPQIDAMGEAIGTLTQALHKQNDAVAAMGDETKRQQSESARASQKAQERAGKAEATSGRLAASSRAGEARAKPCAPSKALEDSWK